MAENGDRTGKKKGGGGRREGIGKVGIENKRNGGHLLKISKTNEL